MRRLVDKFRNFKRAINRARGRRDIDQLLAHANPWAPLTDRVLWLQQIILWLREPARAEDRAANKRSAIKRIETVRLKFIFRLLERNPEWKAKVAETLRSILIEAEALELFGLTRLTREPSFFGEASNRAFRRFLPSSAELHELGPIFNLIFVHGDDDTWVETLPRELFQQVIDLVMFGVERKGVVFANVRADMIDALSILGPMIGSIGMSRDLRSRMTNQSVFDSPFRSLGERIFQVTEQLKSSQAIDSLSSPTASAVEAEILACRERIRDVLAHLEQTGVSVKLVYRLETLNTLLERVEILLSILIPDPAIDRTVTMQKFVSDLIREGHQGESIRYLFKRNLDLISRKVVERVGQSGEHYITTSKREWFEMIKAGGGGGILTVLTTVLKFAISGAHLPMFFDGLFSWLNYSLSFMTMQVAHFALATKQPSMTASALANKLRHLNHRRYLKEFVDEVTRITRSQFAAALGNVGFVIPGAILFDFAVMYVTGKHVIDPHYAVKVIASLNPLTSLTIPAAAITGAILWVAAIAGGWLENWSAYHGVPQALATNRRLTFLFGQSGAQRISKTFAKEVNGVGTNVSVGFLLAFTPITGSFFGAPIDVRHITLSTGAVTFAVLSIGWQAVDKVDLAWAALGLLITLSLNFGVSFALALFVAIRARRIKKLWIFAVARGVLRRFTTKPSQFFFPPRD